MDPSKMLQDKRDEILRIAAAHGAQNVRVFGSVSRGEAGAKSDVDLLVKDDSTARIQEAHQLLIHVLCEIIEARMEDDTV